MQKKMETTLNPKLGERNKPGSEGRGLFKACQALGPFQEASG